MNNDGIENTDIPNLNSIKLPEKSSISQEKIGEVRNYVLQFVSSDQKNMNLDMRKCELTGETIFEGSLKSQNSTKSAEECIITGFPVLKSQSYSCNNCKKSCNKNDWNTYVGVFNSCP